jgi:hypothetical protein
VVVGDDLLHVDDVDGGPLEGLGDRAVLFGRM